MGESERNVWDLCNLIRNSPLLKWVTTQKEGAELAKDYFKHIAERTGKGESFWNIRFGFSLTKEYGETVRRDGGELVPVIGYGVSSDFVSEDEMEKGKGRAIFEFAKKYMDKVKEAKHPVGKGPMIIDHE